MKNIIVAVTALLIFNCCNKKDDDKLKNPIDQLPPATQIGANTAGCLVDGEALLPNNKSLQPLVLNYLGGEDFSLSFSKEINGIFQKIFIYIGSTQLQVGKTYQLEAEIDNDSKYGFYLFRNSGINEILYQTTATVIGKLTITNHDFDNAILSGTFWFDAINSDGSIVEVRDGRFDMEY